MRQDYFEKMRLIFGEVLGREITNDEMSDGENLVGKFSIDSLMGLQLIIKIEQEFEVIIEDDELAIALVDSGSKLQQYIEKYNSKES